MIGLEICFHTHTKKGVPEDVEPKECFIELITSSSMEDAFKEKSLVSFWMSTINEE